MLEGNHKVHDGEGFKNLQILRTSSTDRLREIRTKGREGFQKVFVDGGNCPNGQPLMQRHSVGCLL